VSGEIVVDTEADLTSLTEESQSCGGRRDATTGVKAFLKAGGEGLDSLLFNCPEKLGPEYQSASWGSWDGARNLLEMSKFAMG